MKKSQLYKFFKEICLLAKSDPDLHFLEIEFTCDTGHKRTLLYCSLAYMSKVAGDLNHTEPCAIPLYSVMKELYHDKHPEQVVLQRAIKEYAKFFQNVYDFEMVALDGRGNKMPTAFHRQICGLLRKVI
jgi:hypothetical protein